MAAPEKGTPEYLRLLTQKLHDMGLITTCLTCVHFDNEKNICSVYNQLPPPQVIGLGCITWDYLPF